MKNICLKINTSAINFIRGEVMEALVFLMAISLSMDAFSLALAYGTLGMSKKNKYLLSIIVGCYHFVMPLLGILVGNIILQFFKFNADIVTALILIFIGVQMVISSFKNEEVSALKLGDFFLFGLAVSIDSFSLGITLPNMEVSIIFSVITFALISGLFTFFGLSLGNKIEKLLGKIATILGGSILSIIGVIFLL